MGGALLAIALVFAVAEAVPAPALAAAKKRPQPPPSANAGLVRAIQVDPIADRYIELPNPEDPVAMYGSNIFTELVTYLDKTQRFAVLAPDGPAVARKALFGATPSPAPTPAAAPPDPCIIETPPVASAEIAIKVDELSFATGAKGTRLFYGFARGQENPYNAGIDAAKRNEFPLSAISGQVNWFENIFNDTGNLRSGLELASELNFDILIAGAKLKHEEYHAALGLDVLFKNHDGSTVHRQLEATGSGYYWDLSANFVYEGGDYMIGAMLSRKTALLTAFNNTIASAVRAIESEVDGIPLVSTLAAVCGGAYYVAAGANYGVPVGTRFFDLTQQLAGATPTVFAVTAVFQRSASLSVSGTGFNIGDELVSLAPGAPAPAPKPPVSAQAKSQEPGGAAASAAAPAQTQTVDTGQVDIDLPDALKAFVESSLTRLGEGLKIAVELPYLIWRYFQYDQSYNGGELKQPDAARAEKIAAGSWAARSIGLDQYFAGCVGKGVSCLGSRSTIVAVIDSGVDYDHRELRRNIFWDGATEQPGYDYISGDPRPYDDHAHGTEVASVIAGGGGRLIGVAPNATILPIKVFSPYGVTSSAAMYSAFQYAVASGARIVVLGWGTQRQSKAIEDGVKLAQANGLLVVAGAGDGGMDLSKRAYYPAAFAAETPNMVVVAGYAQDGGLTQASGLYSNYGPGVDLAAPGGGVLVAQPRSHYTNGSNSGIASGFVAGTLALLWSQCPTATAQTVKTALLSGARVQPELQNQIPGNMALSVIGAAQQLDQVCK